MADPRSIWDDVDSLLGAPPAAAAPAPTIWKDVDQLLASPPLVPPGGSTVSSGEDLSDLTAFERSTVERTRAAREPVPVTPKAPPSPVRAPINANGVTTSARVLNPAVEPGNIDLYAQPKVKNADGTTSTVDSHSYGLDGLEVLLPSVTPDGRHLKTDGDIVGEYLKTGRHLGKFQTPADATAYAEQLHNDYAAGKYDRQPSARLGSAKTGGMATATPGTMPVLDAPAEGVAQIKGALPVLGKAATTPLPLEPPNAQILRGRYTGLLGKETPPMAPETKEALSDTVEGGLKIAEPAMAAGAAMAPASTAAAVAAAMGAGKAVEKGVEALGGTPADSRLWSNIVQAAVGAWAGAKVHAGIRSAGDAARAAAAAGEAADALPGLGGETGPVNVGAGRTAAAAERPPATAYEPVRDAQGGIVGVRPSAPTTDVWDVADQVLDRGPQTAPVDESGRDLGGFAGPERRAANQGPPAGTEERRLLPRDQVLRDIRENPGIVQQADDMKRRADEARPEAPPREADDVPTPEETRAMADRLEAAGQKLAAADYRRMADEREARAKGASDAVSDSGAVAGGLRGLPGAGDAGQGGPVGPRDAGRVQEPAAAEAGTAPAEAGAAGEGPAAAAPAPVTYFRSGASRPADFKGFADARVPVGVTATEVSGPMHANVVNYVRDGGAVFVDSGAFGASPDKPVDFDKVLKTYESLAANVRGGRGNLSVVAPDVVGEDQATRELQHAHGDRLRAIAARGAGVIFPIQKTAQASVASQWGWIRQNFGPDAILGVPSNKAAFKADQVARELELLPPAERPRRIHLLGMGDRNAAFDAAAAVLQKAMPGVQLSSDSNRVAALFGAGRPAQEALDTKVERRAEAGVDDKPAQDTTELTGQLWGGQFDAFSKPELERVAKAVGIPVEGLYRRAGNKTLRQLLDTYELSVEAALHEIALERGRKDARPGARAETITEHEKGRLPVRDKGELTYVITGKGKTAVQYSIAANGEVQAWRAVGKSGKRWASDFTLDPVKSFYPREVLAEMERRGIPIPEGQKPRSRGSEKGITSTPSAGEPAIGARVKLSDGREGTVRELVTAGKAGGKGAQRLRRRARVFVEGRGQKYEQFVDLDKLVTLEAPHEPADTSRPAETSERAHESGPEPEGGRDESARGSGDQDRETDTPVPTDAETVDTLVRQAVDAGWTGDQAALRAELQSRLELVHELDTQLRDAGRDPVVLMKAIRDRGGISIKRETAQKGELRWLSENAAGGTARGAGFGRVAGVSGVFNRRGLSFDEMLQSLRADGRFTHLETLDDLYEELRAAGTYEQPAAAVDRFVEGLGHEWWTRLPERLTPEPVDIASAGDEGDVSFNPEELERVDKLDTGEEQRRLPVADKARQVGKADTSFKAPVQASGDDFDLSDGQEEPDKQEPLFMPAGKRPLAAVGPGAKEPLPTRPVPVPRTKTTLEKLGLRSKRKAIPVAEIQKKLSELFRVPVGTRHFPQRALGIYKPDVSAVRLGTEEDLQVLGHEFGHHLDMAIMEGSRVFNRGPIAAELKKVGAATSLPSYDAGQRRREGTAEFFRRWLTEPEQLQQDAPLYYAAFQQFLDHANPKLVDGLYDIREEVQRYLSLSPEDQARLHIDFTGGSGSVLAVARDIAAAAKNPEQRARTIAYLSSQWMDDLAYIKLAEQALHNAEPVDVGQSAYVQARLARGYAAKAEGFLEHGVRDYDGQFLGRSLDDALAPVYDRLHDFALYAAAVRAADLHKRGKASGFSTPQLNAVLEKYKGDAAFNTALDGLREFHKAKRAYLVASGILSPEAAAKMAKLEPNYVPFERLREVVGAAVGGRKIANRTSPIKRIKGSGRRIVNPLETIIKNTHAEVNAAETNLAMRKLVRTISGPGSAEWLEEIPEPQVMTRFNLQKLEGEIRNLLGELGVEELPDGGTTLDEYLDQMVKVFTPRTFARGNERFITVIDGDKLRWFEVHDHGLYDALTAVGPQGTEQVVRMFFRGARLLKSFATTTVGFIIRNPIKDQYAAMTFSRAGYRPTDFLRGLAEYLKAGERYQQYLTSGADQANLVADDRDLLRRRLKQLGQSKVRRFVGDTILNPLDGLRVLSAAGETATRLGEFMRTLNNEGEVNHRSLQIAALNARDVTQDFQKAGRQPRAWNQYTAFFSARVGGYGRMWEAAKENPTGFVWKSLLAITLPTLALWALNHDDPEYNEIPAWERNYYWHIPFYLLDKDFDVATLKASPKSVVSQHGWIKIPKPFELGQMFGTSLEVFLDWLKGQDPNAASRMMDRATAFQTLQQAIPTGILPFIEVAANYDFFRDRTIVNPWQQDLAPELQYSRWTSETAKKLGELLDMSPSKIETIIYGYTAGVGQGTLMALDPLMGGKKPAAGPGHWPAVGAIWRDRATSEAQSLQDLYSAKALLEGLTASVKEWHALGKDDRARAEIEKNRRLAPYEQGIKQADAALKKWRTAANEVFDTPTLTPAQKREALDKLYLDMLNIARSALGRRPLERK